MHLLRRQTWLNNFNHAPAGAEVGKRAHSNGSPISRLPTSWCGSRYAGLLIVRVSLFLKRDPGRRVRSSAAL